MAWIPGDVSGSQVLDVGDHLHAEHINELRAAIDGQRQVATIVGKSDPDADFNTDDYESDRACIQAALDLALSSPGGVNTVVLPGTYTLDDELIIYSNTTVSSAIPRLAVFDASSMALTPKTGQGGFGRWWIIRTLNNTTARENISLKGIKFIGKLDTLYTVSNYSDQTKQQAAFGFKYTTNVTVEECEFYNLRVAVLAGVNFNGGAWDAGMTNANVKFCRNSVSLCQGGLQVYSVDGIQFDGNDFENLADDCMAALGDCDNVTVCRNKATDGAIDNGLGVSAACNMFKVDTGEATFDAHSVSVYENRADSLHRGVVVTAGADYINCHNNKFTNCRYAGIQIANSNKAKIVDNEFSGCNSLLDASVASIVVLAVDKAQIIRNEVIGAGLANENGIRTVDVVTLDMIANETNVGGYGINVDTTTDLLFRDNITTAGANATRGILTANVTGKGWFFDNRTPGSFSVTAAQIGNLSSFADPRYYGNPDIKGEGNNSPRLALARSINALVTGDNLIYIVPTGKRLIITSILVRVATVTGVNTLVPSISIGGNASSYNDFLANTALTGVVGVSTVYAYSPQGAVATYPQGTQINLKVNTAATGNSALIYDVDVFGELV